ncbi:MAG: transporter [Pseudomonadota bacterium]
MSDAKTKRFNQAAGKKIALLIGLTLLATGCSTLDSAKFIAKTNEQVASFTQGNLVLAQNQAEHEAMQRNATQLLSRPLEQNDALQLALFNSPQLQAILAQHWAYAAQALEQGRMTNPLFTVERLSSADSLELGRMLSFGLLDLLSLPQRSSRADNLLIQQQIRLSSKLIEHLTQVRQAWVSAVAAQQQLVYAQQVDHAAQASNELAKRLEQAGNFSAWQRAKQQAFYADAATQSTTAQHHRLATREALVRLLGLSETQAGTLRLPDRLPELPSQARTAEEISKLASQTRLDIQLAQAILAAHAKAQGLPELASLSELSLGLQRKQVVDQATANTSAQQNTQHGYEISLRLPLFNWGEYQHAALNAQTLAAANQLEASLRAASSSLRERYSAYRSAFALSKHYRDELIPLRKLIAQENILRYNAMLISPFELLADSREQIQTVLAALAAEEQFWLADAALQAELIGTPSTLMTNPLTTNRVQTTE